MKEAVGEIIRETIRKSGITQEDFATEMGMSHRNLANLLNKKHIPIEQLIRVSKLLKRDFIKDYNDWLYENDPVLTPYKNDNQNIGLVNEEDAYVSNKNQISFTINVKGSFDTVSKEMSNFLISVKKEAEERGLHLV